MCLDLVHARAVPALLHARLLILPVADHLRILEIRALRLQAVEDEGKLRRVDRRLADEAVQAVKLQLLLQPLRPRALRRIAEVVPDRAGYDVVTREDVQDVDEDVAHNADRVDRMRDRAAHAVEIAEIVAADTDVEDAFLMLVEDRLQLAQHGRTALDVSDGGAFEDGHDVAPLRRPLVQRAHQLHVGFDVAEIHLRQHVARQDVARLAHEIEEMLHVVGRAHAHEEQRQFAPLGASLLQRTQIPAQGSLGVRDRSIVDRVFQAEANGGQMRMFLPANLLHDILLVGGHVEKPAHLVLQEFPVFHSQQNLHLLRNHSTLRPYSSQSLARPAAKPAPTSRSFQRP